MKILHMISGGELGGAKTHVHTLLSGLCKTEDVLLVCFIEGSFAEEAKALGIPTLVLDTSVPGAVRRLTRLIREQGFELLHCHGSRANLIGSLLKHKVGLPLISTVHSDYRRDYKARPLAGLTYGSVNKLALRQMDFWIGVSPSIVDRLHERGFDPNRTFVIPNGIDFSLGAPAQARTDFLRALGIEPQANLTVFGCAARMDTDKDIRTLLRAFSRTAAVCPEARLLIAGDGSQRRRMEALAAELCPAGTVVFVGWITDTKSFFSSLDVNILVSVSESFPYALPEGAICRCATIAARLGNIPNPVEHEVNGLLFPPRNEDALAAEMIRLAQNPALIRLYADHLYEKVRRDDSVEAMLERQKQIYQTVLRRTARAASRKRDGVLICGAYGKGNSGDDAILTAIAAALRERDSDLPIYATSRAPARTARDVEVGSVYAFNPWRLHRLMRRTALYLSGGGSLIQDATSTRSLRYYLYSLRAARRRGNRVMMFGCGIGPVRRPINRRRARQIIQECVDQISLRDRTSLLELQSLGVTGIPVSVTADLAFLIQPADPVAVEALCAVHGIAPSERLLILAPRPWEGAGRLAEAFAETARYAAEAYGYRSVLLAMEPERDRSVCRRVAALAAEAGVVCPVWEANRNVGMVVGLIRRADAVLAMRLHALIFAASQGTRYAGVSYDPKVSGFLRDMEQSLCCTLEEADASRLKALVDGLLNAEDSTKTARRLRELAKENFDLAFSLLEQK